ncbi:MAG: ABC transporter ATP-binding protein [Myxococcota bacterium]
MTPLLEIENLKTVFTTGGRPLCAVDGVSLTVEAGAVLGLLGESGCGKTATALSVMRLVSAGQVSGQVRLRGRELFTLSEEEMRRVRGAELAMVFQEPMTSLNPVFRVGEQVAEPLRVHRGLLRKEARARAIELLRQVEVFDPERWVDAYPHELSGGMRQRVLLAMALACEPSLLIADEPTSALDVTVQAQVLALLRQLAKERRMGVLLITHDLGVVAQACDEVAVMYGGRVVERSPAEALFRAPAHPYTVGLLRSIPSLKTRGGALEALGGAVPTSGRYPAGCRFKDRCARVLPSCDEEPALVSRGEGRVACHNPVENASA